MNFSKKERMDIIDKISCKSWKLSAGNLISKQLTTLNRQILNITLK